MHLDRHSNPTTVDHFTRFVDDVEAPDPVARRVLGALRATATESAGVGQQALFELVMPSLPTLALETVSTLSALCQPENPRLLIWEPRIRQVLESLEDVGANPAVAQLSHNWWHTLARAKWRSFPVETLPTLRSLSSESWADIAPLWIERAPWLGNQPGEAELLHSLDRELIAHPHLYLSFRNRLAAAEVHRGRVRLEGAFHELYDRALKLDDGQSLFVAEARVLLPEDNLERAKCLIQLLLSDEVFQTVKFALERGVLRATLHSVEEGPWDWLPAFKQLEVRSPVLLGVVAQIGRHWDLHPYLAEKLLVSALADRRFDAIRALLQTARMRQLEDRSFLQYLSKSRTPMLLARLHQALEDPSGRWWLEELAEEIQQV